MLVDEGTYDLLATHGRIGVSSSHLVVLGGVERDGF